MDYLPNIKINGKINKSFRISILDLIDKLKRINSEIKRINSISINPKISKPLKSMFKDTDMDGFNTSLIEANTIMKNQITLARELNREMSTLNTNNRLDLKMEDAKEKMSDYKGKLEEKIGMLKDVSVPILSAAKFEEQMIRIKIAGNYSPKRFDFLQKKALEISANSGFSNIQVGKAMEYLTKTNIRSPKKMLPVMNSVMDLAKIANVEPVKASEDITDIMSNFNLKSTDSDLIVDLLSKITVDSNMSYDSLLKTINQVAPSANELKIPFKEIAVMAGLLNKVKISGTDAGKVMDSMMTNLNKPGAKAREALEKLNVKIPSGDLRDMHVVIADIAESTKNFDKIKKKRILEDIFGKKTSEQVYSLFDMGSGKIRTYGKEKKQSNGYGKQIADELRNSTTQSFARLSKAIDSFMVSISIPLLPIVNWITKIITKVVALANFLSNNFGPIGSIIYGIVLSVVTLSGAFCSLGFAINVCKVLKLTFLNNLNLIKNTCGGISSRLSSMKLAFIESFNGMRSSIKSFSSMIYGNLKTALVSSAKRVKIFALALGQGAKKAIMASISGLGGLMSSMWTFATTTLPAAITTVWSFTTALLANPITWVVVGVVGLIAAIIMLVKHFDKVKKFFSSVGRFFSPMVKTLKGVALKIKDFFFSIFDGIYQFVSNCVSHVKIYFNGFGKIISDFGSFFQSPIGAIKGVVKKIISVFNGLSTSVKRVVMVILGIFSLLNPVALAAGLVAGCVFLVRKLKEVFSEFNPFKWLQNKFLLFINYISSLDLTGILSSFLLKIDSFFSQFSFYESGKKILMTLIDGIKSVAGSLKDKLFSVFKEAGKLLPFSDAKEGPFSHLTKSGYSVVSTLVSGIEKGKDIPKKTLSVIFKTALPGFSMFASMIPGIPGIDSPVLERFDPSKRSEKVLISRKESFRKNSLGFEHSESTREILKNRKISEVNDKFFSVARLIPKDPISEKRVSSEGFNKSRNDKINESKEIFPAGRHSFSNKRSAFDDSSTSIGFQPVFNINIKSDTMENSLEELIPKMKAKLMKEMIDFYEKTKKQRKRRSLIDDVDVGWV